MKKLLGQTVFITGGLSGIGKACAITAAKEGANLSIIDLMTKENENAMKEILILNPEAIYVECDVSIYSHVEVAVQKTVDNLGSLDIALNNAGIGGQANKIGDMTEHDWQKVIAVNLNGVFNCMRHELNYMTTQKNGKIINMSSILGKVGFAGASHYVAAKHGVIGLTQTAALEYALEGITVNAICPGFINTPLLTKGGIDNEHNDIKQHIVNMHPLHRLGLSEEIASAFLFLASKENSFMTGSCLEIDGGFLAQ